MTSFGGTRNKDTGIAMKESKTQVAIHTNGSNNRFLAPVSQTKGNAAATQINKTARKYVMETRVLRPQFRQRLSVRSSFVDDGM